MRILAVADAGKRTGFERVARGILTHLHEAKGCDITLLGINYTGAESEATYPYPVLPISTIGDAMGFESLDKAVEETHADVVWVLQDLWHLQIYAALKTNPVPLACYFPVDAPNLKWQYTLGLGAASAAAVYTKFGAQEAAAGVRSFIDMLMKQNAGSELLSKPQRYLRMPASGNTTLNVQLDRLLRYQNLEGFHVIPHGLDASAFQVRPKADARQRFGLPDDAFVVLNVGTNQFRKRMDLTLRAFALLSALAPEARLVMHCAGHTAEGWDLRQLAHYLGIEDKCVFVHEIVPMLDEDDLIWLYNTADVQINTAGGEGWSLCNIEGAACGVPQMVPDWSATREIWTNYGAMIPVSDWRIETRVNTAHAICDARSAGAMLVDLWMGKDRRELLSEAGSRLVQRQATWAQVGDWTYQLLLEALNEPAAQPISFQEIIEARVGDVKSELQDALWLDRGRPVRRDEVLSIPANAQVEPGTA